MTQEQILFEHYQLQFAWLEADAACKYYDEINLQVMEDVVSQNEGKAEKEELEHLSPSELSKKLIEVKEAFARIEASKELSKQINKLKEKAIRRRNEAKQRLDAFCKRHGIENMDDYVESSES